MVKRACFHTWWVRQKRSVKRNPGSETPNVSLPFMTYGKHETGTRSNYAIKSSTTKSIYFLVFFYVHVPCSRVGQLVTRNILTLVKHGNVSYYWIACDYVEVLRIASPQTSFGVGEEMNAWQTNPKGRPRGGYPAYWSMRFLNSTF